MDDYPEHLAPEFEESGAVKTPFDEWWARVRAYFPTVPEAVARYWLHEHWSHSPYAFLVSRNYDFELSEWESADFWKIQSCWCEFDPHNVQCAEHGEHLATQLKYRTAVYMIAHGGFPAPIIVLDNRDGHLSADREPKPHEILPAGFVLVEGHRRYNIGLYLQKTGLLQPKANVWLMKRRPIPCGTTSPPVRI